MRKQFSSIIVIICVLISLLALNSNADVYDLQLGDLGKPDDYDQTIKDFKDFFRDTSDFDTYTAGVLPSRFDWREEGSVTLAKDQGRCGSCWAFASVGALESKILMKENSEWDLSEQQLISCFRYDCNGGRSDSVLYWNDRGPMKELCTGYEDYSTPYPGVGSNVTCTSIDQCLELPYRVIGYYTVNTRDINEIKTSLYNDGPSYFSYRVYQDFHDFWFSGASGQIYTQTTGTYAGGHAVLIIGWDDTKKAWLCKNSWGKTEGPNGDGTFWIAYSDHANDLRFGMSNFSIVGYTEQNKPPTADAGNDQTVKEGETVTLDGSASKDSDDGIASYQWEQTGGVSVNIQNTTADKATFVAPNSQTVLTFKLTVTDQSGESDSDTCTVNVVPSSSPVLVVIPSVQEVSITAGTTSFSVQNNGSGDMNWTASVNASWVLIESGSSGLNNGTIKMRYQTNTGGARSAIITILAPGAKDSPKYVEIKQPTGTAGTFTFETLWPDSPYKFKFPAGIATDKEGNLYVADWGNKRIQIISSNGDILKQLDTPDCLPTAVTISNGGDIYIGNNFEIIKYSSTGEFMTKWGSTGTGDGQFKSGDGSGISDMVIDKNGYLYVADRFNHRIQKFNLNGDFITKWGSQGSADGQFDEPYSIATDSDGNVYISDGKNHRIQKFTSNGVFISKWGKHGYSGEGEFAWDTRLSTDSDNYVYVVDRGTSLIQKFTSDGVFLSNWGGKGEDDGKFHYPHSIAADDFGNIYVLDDRVQKFTSEGNFLTRWGSGVGDNDLRSPDGIAVDSKENVYVVDHGNYRIQKFSSDGSFIRNWGKFGTGDGGEFNDPTGIAIDQDDNVYIVDTSNARIQKFDENGNFITMWGKRGKGNGEFNYARAIAVDKNNNVYIIDTYNYCVQKFTSSGEFILRWGNEGTEDGEFKNLVSIAVDGKGYVYTAETWNGIFIQKFTSDGQFITRWGKWGFGNGEFNPINGISADEDGNVYVSDGNNRVQKFTSDGQYVAQFGEKGFDAGQFNYPSFLCVSSSGRIYISDTGNERVQVFLENERTSLDSCPDDPDKAAPGVCGCGVSDTDTDSDGTLDCQDNCPSDPNKTEPGTKGCGISEDDGDNGNGGGGGGCFISTSLNNAFHFTILVYLVFLIISIAIYYVKFETKRYKSAKDAR